MTLSPSQSYLGLKAILELTLRYDKNYSVIVNSKCPYTISSLTQNYLRDKIHYSLTKSVNMTIKKKMAYNTSKVEKQNVMIKRIAQSNN